MSEVKSEWLVIRCKSCGAKLKVPAKARGRCANCPSCACAFRIPSMGSITQASRYGSVERSAIEPRRFNCDTCGAKIKVPADAVGRRVKCPKCSTVMRVPAPARADDRGASEFDDDLLSELAGGDKAGPPPPAPPRTPTETGATIRSSLVPQAAPATDTRTCPSCRKKLPGDARICVACGVYVDTGRSIITTQDENLDRIYAIAESTIRAISWLIWLGIYPIASEAFGLRKPWVVRGIAVLTILTSFAFFACMLTQVPAERTFEGMMLWAGDPEAAGQLLEELELDESEDVRLRELAESAIREHLASACQFRPLQLLTYALLHADILHLAGNMLFLMVLGARVNALIGSLWTVVLYPLLAIIAGLAHMLSVADGLPIPMLGASGAVMGMAGMYLVLFPVHNVHMAAWVRWVLIGGFRLSLRLFAVRGFWVVLFYIAFDVVYTILRIEDNVAHWAHLGGFIAGFVIALALLLSRLVDARGGDLLSATLGRHAWKLIGRPRQANPASSAE